MALAQTQIVTTNRLHGANEQIRIVKANQRRVVGTVVVLCETKYSTLAALDKHMELPHTGNGGLAELPRVFIVDGSAIPVDIGPQRGRAGSRTDR